MNPSLPQTYFAVPLYGIMWIKYILSIRRFHLILVIDSSQYLSVAFLILFNNFVHLFVKDPRTYS